MIKIKVTSKILYSMSIVAWCVAVMNYFFKEWKTGRNAYKTVASAKGVGL